MNYDQDITDDDGKDVGGNFDFIEKTQFVFLKVWHQRYPSSVVMKIMIEIPLILMTTMMTIIRLNG